MYKSRPLIVERPSQPLIELSASYANIPIKEDWSERWCVMPKLFDNIMDDIINFEVRDDDVFLVTFMKCGTTWMQETAWLLMNDLNYEGAMANTLMQRSPFLDANGLLDVPGMESLIKKATELPETSPRLLKTHLPANLLPMQMWEKKAKIIYVARNPKDCFISSYHFVKALRFFDGTLEEYLDEFLSNKIINTPYWPHIMDFWKMQNEPHVFFTTYEDMQRDLSSVINKLTKFLGKPTLSEEQMAKLTDHLSFAKMKDNASTNPTKVKKPFVAEDFEFMRRGIVGSFKDELTPKQRQLFDEWSSTFLKKHNLKEEDIFGKL